MSGIRELLAVVLGAGLGVALLLAPRTALRLSVFVGPTRRRQGDYGSEDPIPDQWAWVVRALGVGCLAIVTYLASQLFV